MSKKVEQLDRYTGDVINVFDSAVAADKETKASRTGIIRTCKGKGNQSGGFKWKYKDDKDYIFTAFDGYIKLGKPLAVEQLDRYTGDVIRTFNTMTEASNYIGAKDLSSISQVCRGKKVTAGGFKWRYKTT